MLLLSLLSLISVSSSLELPFCPVTGPRVHTHSRCFFLRPATGVSGHRSLSESSSSDARFSPVLGERAVRDKRDTDFGLVLLSETAFAKALPFDEPEVESTSVEDDDGEDDEVEASVDTESDDISSSEWATVYLVVWISSSKGARNETRFCGGNIGRLVVVDILTHGNGLLRRMDRTLYDSLYGIRTVADSADDEESVEVADSTDAELGVRAADVESGDDDSVIVDVLTEESIARRGLIGRGVDVEVVVGEDVEMVVDFA